MCTCLNVTLSNDDDDVMS